MKMLLHLQVALFQKLGKKKRFSDMSRHSSYGKASKSETKRNVLKRYERIDVLRKLGKWEDGKNTKVTNLPKTPSK
jgi:small basic protein (TIGR04137 family)